MPCKKIPRGPCIQCGATIISEHPETQHCSNRCANFTKWAKGAMFATVPPEKRFWRHVNKTDTCWLWKGFTRGGGYGQFGDAWRIGGKQVYAHRYSWVLHNGPIPEGLPILHKCGNPPCVNPEHLFLGRRAIRRTRLTPEAIADIRTNCGKGQQKSFAEKYGIDPSHVSRIIRKDKVKF